MILDFGRRLWAVEVKLTAHPSTVDMQSLEKAADLVKADQRILLSRVREPASDGRRHSCDLRWFASHAGKLL